MFCTKCGGKNPEAAKFCANCGKQLYLDVESAKLEQLAPTGQKLDADDFREIATTIPCTFHGKDSDLLSRTIGQSMGVSKANKLVFNIYASSHFFLVLPVSKGKSHLALFGLLLGGGVLAVAAMSSLGVLAKRIEDRHARLVMKDDNPLYNALIFNSNELLLQAKETRTSSLDLFDIFKKETWISISGLGTYKNEEYDISIHFGFEGQASDPNKKKIAVFDNLCKALRISVPEIYKGGNPPF